MLCVLVQLDPALLCSFSLHSYYYSLALPERAVANKCLTLTYKRGAEGSPCILAAAVIRYC